MKSNRTNYICMSDITRSFFQNSTSMNIIYTMVRYRITRDFGVNCTQSTIVAEKKYTIRLSNFKMHCSDCTIVQNNYIKLFTETPMAYNYRNYREQYRWQKYNLRQFSSLLTDTDSQAVSVRQLLGRTRCSMPFELSNVVL